MIVFSCESSRAVIVSATRCMDARRSTERAWSRATASTAARSARISSRISMSSSRCVIPTAPESSPAHRARVTARTYPAGEPGSRCGSDQRAVMDLACGRQAAVSTWPIGPWPLEPIPPELEESNDGRRPEQGGREGAPSQASGAPEVWHHGHEQDVGTNDHSPQRILAVGFAYVLVRRRAHLTTRLRPCVRRA